MKAKKKYCLNIASYKYKSGYKHLLPPIIIKESSNLNINILNLVPSQNKCPCGKSCPNYKIIFELKQEIIKLIDKISQLKKITDLSTPKMKEENSKNLNSNANNESNFTPEKDKHDNISNQLINSFRNSSKNKLLKLNNSPYSKNNLFRYNLIGTDKIKLRPNSAKNSQLKESLDKAFNKGKESNNTNEKKEGEIRFKNISNSINKKINMNFFSSSSQKRNENPLKNKKINNNHRYETEIGENNSNSRNIQFFTHESFSSLKKEKINELSSLNLHLSNSIISPAIKITPKNLFESIIAACDNKENKIFNENKNNDQ
jgi:hypothetical protein